METEFADQEYALNVARMLLGSLPNQPHDPETFLTQLTITCTGRPKLLLRKAVDPRNGFIATERFPNIAALNEWFGKQAPMRGLMPEHKRFPPAIERKLTPEEIERRREQADRARAIADQMRRTSRRMTVGRQMDVSVLTEAEREAIAEHIANPDAS